MVKGEKKKKEWWSGLYKKKEKNGETVTREIR
jgi:hypothetical protein